MEQVFFRLHVRSCAVITNVFPKPVRYSIEVASFFVAVLLLLVLGTLHLTFVGNETSTLCFTNHVHQNYPHIGIGELLTPMSRSWWKDTDVLRLHVQAWELCAAPTTAYAGGILKRSQFCDSIAPHRNYTGLLQSLQLGPKGIDETLPPLYKSFSGLIGQHISIGQNVKDRRVKQALMEKADWLFSSLQINLSCSTSCHSSNKDGCTCPPSPSGNGFHGTIGDLLRFNRANALMPSSALFLEVWNRFLNDFVEDSVSMFAADSLYLFAIEKGYLMMSPSLRARHNVSVLDVVMPKTSECFRTSYEMLPHLTAESDASSGFGLGLLKYAKNVLLSVPELKALLQDEKTTQLLTVVFEYLRVPSNYVIQNIIGYDVIVTNWMINMFDGKGYLFNAHSKDVFDVSRGDTTGGLEKSRMKAMQANAVCIGDGYCELPSDEPTYNAFTSPFVRSLVSFFQPTAAVVQLLPSFWQKLVILASTMFLFFTTSTLVSFTLKETQERMLRFTYLLQYHIREGMSVTKLVCTHLIESLVFVPIMVGIMGFLYEFFGDSMLTFLLLSMLWICECYTVVCVRTTTSAMLFPRFSFVLFCFFHFYSFSFPFGFSYIALATVSTMLWYIMLHFWNQYELPALMCGQINALNVREMYQGGILSMIPESMHHLSSAAAESARDSGSAVPILIQEEERGSVLYQIIEDSHERAVTKAQLLSKHRSPGSLHPNPAAVKHNPRIPKQGQKPQHTAQDASFPPLPIPARLRSTSTEKKNGYSAPVASRAGGNWMPSREVEDNDYDVGLSLDGDDGTKSPRIMPKKSPKAVAPLTVSDHIELSRRIQAQEMEAAVNNMVMRTSSRLSVGRDLAALGGTATPTSVDSYGYQKDQFSVFGNNQDD